MVEWLEAAPTLGTRISGRHTRNLMDKLSKHISVSEVLTAVAEGDLRVSDIAEACLSRIGERESDVKAWRHIDPDSVRGAAARSDKTPVAERGPLHGLPVGIKDIFDTADMPTGYGSQAYATHQPSSDAAVVALLRNVGAIVVGKTVTTEFAAWPPGATRNPRDLSRTPGGSSSGSAAAVADCMVPIAFGTQTLGSVIRPASYCGVVGFKPSYGFISRAGVKPLAESLDTVGMFARSVEDIEHVFRVLCGRPAVSFMTEREKPVLAFCRGPNWTSATADARDAIEVYVAGLRTAGLRVDELTLPPEVERVSRAAKIIHDYESWHGFAFERIFHSDRVTASLREGLRKAESLTQADFVEATQAGERARCRFPEAVKGYDAVISLSATGEAPAGQHSTGDPIMNSMWTLLYAPCVTIPVLTGASGLPIGIQVIAPRYQDDSALNVAQWLLRSHSQRQVVNRPRQTTSM